MKNIASILLILLLILLVACQNDSAPATAVSEPTVAVEDTPLEEAPPEAAEESEAPEPTAAPTEIPTEEPAAEPTADREHPQGYHLANKIPGTGRNRRI